MLSLRMPRKGGLRKAGNFESARALPSESSEYSLQTAKTKSSIAMTKCSIVCIKFSIASTNFGIAPKFSVATT